MNDAISRLCPVCGLAVTDPPTGGPRRKFDTDECRKQWNAQNSMMAREAVWLRERARDCRANARFCSGAVRISWGEHAERYDREADKLDADLAERRGKSLPRVSATDSE